MEDRGKNLVDDSEGGCYKWSGPYGEWRLRLNE